MSGAARVGVVVNIGLAIAVVAGVAVYLAVRVRATAAPDRADAACDRIASFSRSGAQHYVGASELIVDLLVHGVERTVARHRGAAIEPVLVRGVDDAAQCRAALSHLRAALPRAEYEALVECVAAPDTTPGAHVACFADAGL